MNLLSVGKVLLNIWNTAWPIGVAILLFAVVILIHELGHFLFAKLFKVKVNEFAIGFGPKLIKFQKGETLYSVRAIPFGGFCAMEGEDEESEDENSFGSKNVWKRIIIVAAGAFNNLVLGLILVGIMLGVRGQFSTSQIKGFYLKVGDINKNGIIEMADAELIEQYIGGKIEFDDYQRTYADVNSDGKVDAEDVKLTEQNSADQKTAYPRSYVTGLRTGDKIISIDGRRVFCASDLSYMMMSSRDNTLEMVVKRDGKKVKLDAVEFDMMELDGQKYLRSDFGVENETLTWKKPVSFVGYTFSESVSVARTIWMTLLDMVTGRYGLNDIMGPVGVVSTVSETVSDAASSSEPLIGLDSIFYIMGLITINLGIMNLLPFPALDGGRLVFLLFEAITRKKASAKVEGVINAVGFMILMGFILLVTGNDILRLIKGG